MLALLDPMRILYAMAFSGLLVCAAGPAGAGTRDERVHTDRKDVQATGRWIYNDLAEGLRQARATARPMLVVFR